MTNPSDKSTSSSFSTFGLGVAFGIAASFLFGTEEGRKIVKKVVESIPEKFKNPLESSLRGGTPTRQSHSTTGDPILSPEETEHHAVFDPNPSLRGGTPTWQSHSTEAPPPPAPHVRPSHPEPFTPSL